MKASRTLIIASISNSAAFEAFSEINDIWVKNEVLIQRDYILEVKRHPKMSRFTTSPQGSEFLGFSVKFDWSVSAFFKRLMQE
jgi:hypothetical protein